VMTSNYSIVLPLFILGVSMVVYYYFRHNNYFLFGLVAIIVVQFLSVPSGRYGKIKNSGVNDKNNVASLAILDSLSSELNAEEYRFTSTDKVIADGKWAQNGMYFGLRSFYASITPLPGVQFKELYNSDRYLNYRSLWGAKYWIFNRDIEIKHPALKPTGIANKLYKVLEDKKARPLIYFASGIKKYKGVRVGGFRNFLNKPGNYRNLVCYLGEDLFQQYKKLKTKGQQNEIELIEYKDGLVSWKAIVEKEAIIVVNEYYNEDWKLYNNNEKANYFRINFNQIGTYLPKGEHELKLVFEPKYISTLVLLQKLSFLIILALFLYYIYKCFRSTSEVNS